MSLNTDCDGWRAGMRCESFIERCFNGNPAVFDTEKPFAFSNLAAYFNVPDGNRYGVEMDGSPSMVTIPDNQSIISNWFQYRPIAPFGDAAQFNYVVPRYQSTPFLRFYFPAEMGLSDHTLANEWLRSQEERVKVLYPLAEPVTFDIRKQSIKTLSGHNEAWSDERVWACVLYSEVEE